MNTPLWYCRTVPAPRIGVSACLAGQRVRYDGTDKRSHSLYVHIEPHAEFVPLCPEASLGIPRPPVRLQHRAEGLRAIGVNDPSWDVTEALLAFNASQRNTLAGLCGVILKARSPSCGIGSAMQTRLTGETEPGDGLFAGFIRTTFPWLPRCDEETLEDPRQARHFLLQARLLGDARQAIAEHALDGFLRHHRNRQYAWHSDATRALLAHLHRYQELAGQSG